jgi:hypothetical protein
MSRLAENERPALSWQGLERVELSVWFEWLWGAVCELSERYTLPVRSRWWDNPLQVEVLAALAAWVLRYDSGEWDDPPGKLALLYDLERVASLLREGDEPFYPDRDRPGFDRFLAALEGQAVAARDAPSTDHPG